MRNYYVVLGVSKGADQDRIKRAYREVVKRHHPDVTQDEESAERFHEIRDAYETLSDETRRKEYDRKLEMEESSRRIREGRQVMGSGKCRPSKAGGFSSLRVNEFVDGFMPGIFDAGRNRQEELHYEAILSPEEAARGGVYPLVVSVLKPCPECMQSVFPGSLLCPLCNGTGRVGSERALSLNIPPGVRNGTEIRLPLGDMGAGNVYLIVRVYIDPGLTGTG